MILAENDRRGPTTYNNNKTIKRDDKSNDQRIFLRAVPRKCNRFTIGFFRNEIHENKFRDIEKHNAATNQKPKSRNQNRANLKRTKRRNRRLFLFCSGHKMVITS